MINIKCYLLLVVSGASNLNITAKRFSTTLMNHHGKLGMPGYLCLHNNLLFGGYLEDFAV